TKLPETWSAWPRKSQLCSRRYPECKCRNCSPRSGRLAMPRRNQTAATGKSNVYKEDVMPLLDRVSALIRANLNDLIDRAEDPQKMLKQVILDMQNQMLQVKTQVAIAIADEHLLRKKLLENEEK